MADNISKPDDSSAIDRRQPAYPRTRPSASFSDKSEIEIVERYSKADVAEREDEPRNWTRLLMELNLLLLVVLVGIPVLVYCILRSAS